MIKKYKIDSALFMEIFEKSLIEVSGEEKDLLKVYRGDNNGKGKQHSWTKFMERTFFKMEDNLQFHFKGDSRETLNLYCNNYSEIKANTLKRFEHLDIDATFFDETEYLDNNLLKKLGLSKKNNKLWNLLLSIEHENDYRSSFHEIRQLLQINCPLRVSISYLKPTNDEEEFNNYIDQYFELFKKQEEISQMRIEDEFLLIFGNCTDNAEKSNKIIYRSLWIKKGPQGLYPPEYLEDIEVPIV